ncbi:condensin subunit Smc [Salinibacterium amurskyense]|uniref:Chromosome partition protein Smc n=1 Tax=Salinibacterium amurskyense TaxID=205941 RepID=A0A2M9D8G2_9MICO|nr:AAA family ATPase [Salinibacterium amurskyense]PJJ81942.1 condensin subunit Smc [Salinibacterium amurskyense]RLQ81733.1 chromosome segregation protein SMC [Salinibacterium amurskyense]GHD78739.1 chromosome partition protein Smc [Salinibacterium amurskyense]
MYLKSLTLKGFKSFAQPTTFAFEQGVTCVVGPNGSGKSNVVDALAWVMGEQGAKTLRGGKMEDVIFAGTATKGPLGRAEVILTIDNADGALPIEYSEVTISRTLFRNGGSEYAINGTSCRLLDVQELLSDSGLGREMHVIVGQGQLDAVLHASPEDRRGFIEEAAGILKHRRRKEKTLRKLDAMQANLTRLSDLAGEIRRQLKPLGQQAEIAKEAASIASIVRDARARLLADEVVELRSSINDFSRSESERKTQRIVLQEQLDQNKLREARLEQAQVGDDVDEARRVAFGLESVQERLRSLYTLANQRLSLLGQQSDAPVSNNSVSQTLVDEVNAEADLLAAGVADAEKAVAAAAAATATAKAALDSLDEEIAAQSALVSRHELESAGLTARVEVATSTLTAAQGELVRQQQALAEAQARREAAQAEFEALEAEAGNSTIETDGSLDTAYEAAEAKVSSVQAEIEALREALHTSERERDALAARNSALSLAVDQKDGSSALVAAQLSGIRGLVAEHVKITPGYEAAIAAALGTLADAVLADDRDSAIDALAESASRDFGRVEVVVANAAKQSVSLGTAAGTVPATDVVTAPDGVHGLLTHVLIADDLEAARAAYGSLSNAADLTFVTRDGDVLTQFVLRGGSGAKRSRLELVAERDAAADKLGVVTTQIERTSFELDEKRRELTSAKADAEAALVALREYDAQLAAQSELLGRHRIQAEAAQAECDRLARAVDVAEEAVADATTEVARAQTAADKYQAAPRPMLDVSEREPMLAEVDAARAREVELRIQMETIRERVRAERARAEQLAAQLVREREAAQEQARLAVIRQRQMASATKVVEMLPAVLDSVDRSLSEARVSLASKEAERSAQNEELSALRREESALRERLSAVSESVHGLEMQIYEKKLHLSSLLERSGEELGLVEDVLVAEYGPEVPVPDDRVSDPSVEPKTAAGGSSSEEPSASASANDNDRDSNVRSDDNIADRNDSATDGDSDETAEPVASGRPFVRAEQEARLQKAERKLARLGRVNPLALEEFDALEQRHKFLTEQLTDLTNTRKDLLTIIDELDDKMQSIFASAFEDTKNAFNDVFPVLFPGGTGSIFLTNPDDLLTTGIEVTVKPAGKKIERLSLLSGGERSLAAVALLIAIFKARPSPFYIMDEVEAALDDANLGRLLAIFEDLRQTSQLIVITHQKRTMEIADALYGVSMRADGISAVVGQRVAKETASADAS